MQYNTMSKYMYIIFLLNLSKKFDVKMQGLLRQCEKKPRLLTKKICCIFLYRCIEKLELPRM